MAETAYCALSVYGPAQSLIHKKDGKADLKFKKLGELHEDVEIVHRDFHRKVKHARFSDAVLNAIGDLNYHAQFTQLALEPGSLKKMEKLFAADLKP